MKKNKRQSVIRWVVLNNCTYRMEEKESGIFGRFHEAFGLAWLPPTSIEDCYIFFQVTY